MTLKYLKIPKVLLLFILFGVIVVPAVSARSVTANSDKTVNKDATEDYIIMPAQESSLSNNNVMTPLSTQYISQTQTLVHCVSIDSKTKFIEIDLNWGETSDSLALTVYTPSGSNIGTYYDNSDKSVDGRIHINICPSTVYVQSGTWKFKVYGASVSGTDKYTFTAYAHH
jgi:hypothetical protein